MNMNNEKFKINNTEVDESSYKKFKEIINIMNLKGDTSPKKHGYYKKLKVGIYELSWDSWNNGYYFTVNGSNVDLNGYYLTVNGSNVDLVEYLNIIHKEIINKYELPSTKFGHYEVNKLLDILYLKYPKLKKIIDTNFKK